MKPIALAARSSYLEAMTEALCLTDFATDPYYNMAVDEWLFEKVALGQSAVCVRLYSWSTGAITIGYNQLWEKALDHSRLGQTCLIRRVTGGRALYHDSSELTYAIAIDRLKVSDERLSGSLAKTGAAIADMLVSFLNRVGIEADYLKRSRPGQSESSSLHSAPCFASQARHELVTDNRKVVASAQRRIGSVTFQHGAIKISGAASHPALELSESISDPISRIPALPKDRFGKLAALFFCEVATGLQLELKWATLSQTEKQHLLKRRQYVKNHSIDRRRLNKMSASRVYEMSGPMADL